MVCDPKNEDCMSSKCTNCPGKDGARSLISEEEFDKSPSNIVYRQWVSSKSSTGERCSLAKMVVEKDEFLDNFLDLLESNKLHHFSAKSQSQNLKDIKESLKFNEAVVLGDFAQNFSFTVQNEVQSFHWNNSQATLHPFVVYYRTEVDGEVKSKSFCVISDDLNHTTLQFSAFQRRLIEEIHTFAPFVDKLYYFSDGAGGQYKNRKNFVNLIFHKEDFGLNAEWHFFATSHGKSPCVLVYRDQSAGKF